MSMYAPELEPLAAKLRRAFEYENLSRPPSQEADENAKYTYASNIANLFFISWLDLPENFVFPKSPHRVENGISDDGYTIDYMGRVVVDQTSISNLILALLYPDLRSVAVMYNLDLPSPEELNERVKTDLQTSIEAVVATNLSSELEEAKTDRQKALSFISKLQEMFSTHSNLLPLDFVLTAQPAAESGLGSTSDLYVLDENDHIVIDRTTIANVAITMFQLPVPEFARAESNSD